MSNLSGITGSENFRKFLGTCKDGSLRCFKVAISDKPTLEVVSMHRAVTNWEADWDKMVPKQIEQDQPSFVFYRLDEKDTSGCFFWILISWSPDHANIRQKMMYASTKGSLKQEFGLGQIKEDYYANMREEVTLAGYKRHLSQGQGPGPLSREEEELREVRQLETGVEVGVDTRQMTLGAIQFPFEKGALQAVETYWKKGHDYVQLAIDLAKEIITLGEAGMCSTEKLPGKVPSDKARYHLFRYKHVHEGKSLDSNVFIYSMPGYSISIKERMLYSSCKNAVVDVIEKVYSIPLAKKIEVDSGAELTEAFLQDEVHPAATTMKTMFAKPAAPSRGARRMIKAPIT